MTSVRVLAHRGASRAARENTVEAFALAATLGADGVELDVRLLADGALAVHHDPVLADGRVLATLRSDDLPPHVPQLPEVLTICASRSLEVNVEIKNGRDEPGHDPACAVAGVVADVLRPLAGQITLSISSFDEDTLAAARDALPAVPTGWLTYRHRDWPARLDGLVAAGHRALHPHHAAVDAALVGLAHERGLAVAVWTVDDPGRIAELVALEVDAIITNVPDVARAVVDSTPRPAR